MKRMLFNATHPEELRVAIVDGQKLLDLDIESAVRSQKKGNIYKGKVTRVEPSLEACFVDYGSERQGFLPLKEVSRAYFIDYDPSTPMAQVRIQDVIKEGQELIIQVEKDERGSKGAALTTFVSLAGRYLVLMPNNPKGGGISRRIEGEERAELRQALSQLAVPTEHALIARTAGIGKTLEELQWDLDYLLQLWKAIESASAERAAPFLIYQESNLVVRAIRDYLRNDIAEIIIDDAGVYDRATRFMQQVMPHNLAKLKQYQDNVPLFSRFQIEHQIEAAFAREVQLPSGGSIVIDHTEAIVTIDVNSARSTKGADIEETALQTNLEAVDEIARQLRIRDLGGLIVIDLIDMTVQRNQRTVENRLNEALHIDRARVQVGRISRFGLLEMSRQRLRASLGESNYRVCPRCDGMGHIRSVPSGALSILRILEEEALKENTEAIHAHLPIDTATYLLNEKRHEVNMIETRLATRMVLIPCSDLESPHFKITRLRSEDLSDDYDTVSYKIELPEEEAQTVVSSQPLAIQAPSITQEHIAAPAPPARVEPTAKESTESKGLLKRFWESLMGSKDVEEEKTETKTPTPQKRRQPSGNRGRRPRQDGRRNRPQQRRGGGRNDQQQGAGSDKQRQRRSRPNKGRGRGGDTKSTSKPKNGSGNQSAQRNQKAAAPPTIEPKAVQKSVQDSAPPPPANSTSATSAASDETQPVQMAASSNNTAGSTVVTDAQTGR